LHISQALESIDFARGPVDPVQPSVEKLPGQGTRERLTRSPYFALERLQLGAPSPVGSDNRFTILVGLEGHVDRVHGQNGVPLLLGQTLLLPAAIGPCTIVPSAQAAILSCIVP